MSDDPVTRRAQTRVGAVLRGKWRLDRLIGVGGMASVYEAKHRNGKRGAVKLLHPEVSLVQDVRERFLREGYVANKVDHPGVVSVLDDDETEDGSVFLVMELLEGHSVEAIREARPGKRMELSEVLPLADQLLDVLAASHAKGIVHRDLKPENLFSTSQGRLKVLDFGIARLREASGSASATRTGSMMGTPTFMPPEQALGQWNDVDARTDIWAVGATIFTLLSGRTVHVADSLNKLLLAAMTQPAPPLASVLPSAPPAIAAVVDCALAFEQARRWPSAQAMRDALRAAATAPAATLAPAAVRAVAPPPSVAAVSVVSPNMPSMGGQTAIPVSATLGQRRDSGRGIVVAGIVVTVALAGGGAFALFRPGAGGAAAAPEPRSESVPVEAVSASAPVLGSVDVPPSPVETTPAAVGAAPPASAPAVTVAPIAPGGPAVPVKPAAAKPAATPKPSATSNPLDKW